MRVLVTGATGFVGTNLVRALTDRRKNVRCLVRKTSNTQILKDLGVEMVYGDVRDRYSLQKAVDGVDVIYHLAGEVHALCNREYYQVNVLGTRNLLESCLSGNIKRIVHLSSTGSIGPSKTKGLLLTEDTSPSPINAYGRSKYRAEKVVLQYVEKNKLPITIIRAPVIYGPHQPPVVTRIFQQVTKGKFPVIGDGTALRSLCYIDNLIEGIFLAETNNTIGETYNIADEEVLSIRQIASTIANELGIDLAFTRLPTWVKRLSGFSMRFLDLFGMSSMQLYSVYSIAVDLGCDVSKARATLGYKSKVGFKDGIKHTIQWCKNNGLIN